MGDGEIPPGLCGKIKTVMNFNRGESDHGPWTLQNIILTDVQDPKAEVKVKLKNRDPLPKTIKGRVMYFTCTQSDKGLTGLKMTSETYKNKTSNVVNCTATAWMGEVDPTQGQAQQHPYQPPYNPPGHPAPNQPPYVPPGPAPYYANAPQQQPYQQPAPYTAPAYQPPPQPAPAQQPPAGFYQPPPAPQQPPPESPEQEAARRKFEAEQEKAKRESGYRKGVAETRIFLAKRANLYLLALHTADYIKKQYETQNGGEGAMAQEQYQAMTSSLFISADKFSCAEVLPPGPLENYLGAPKATPTNEQPQQ